MQQASSNATFPAKALAPKSTSDEGGPQTDPEVRMPQDALPEQEVALPDEPTQALGSAEGAETEGAEQSVILDGTLVDAAKQLEELSKYAKKQPLFRQKLQASHSIVQLRVEHAMAEKQGLTYGEVGFVLEALDRLLLSKQGLGQLISQSKPTSAALALLSMAQHLVLLLGNYMLFYVTCLSIYIWLSHLTAVEN